MDEEQLLPPDEAGECEKGPINWWRTILTGVVAGALIAAVLIISQYVSLFWGVFLFVVPISAGIVAFSLKDELLPTFVFFMMLASFSFAASISVMYALLINGYSKITALVVFYVLWLILTGLFFYIFRDKLKQNCPPKE